MDATPIHAVLILELFTVKNESAWNDFSNVQ
jgi:hypothetical protein